ncbi:hypothetical protein [Enterobacter sp. Bisph1]|nr:hypothetical protein [Enterobacter sp. Bisph1]
MNKLHHKPEKKSAFTVHGIIAETLTWLEANRLRKNLCQDLLSGY